MNKRKPRLVLDMDALAAVVSRDARGGCEWLYAELARSGHLGIEYAVGPGCSRFTEEFLRGQGLARTSMAREAREEGEPQIVMRPAGVRPAAQRADPLSVLVFIVFDSLEQPSDEQTASARTEVLADLDARSVVLVFEEQTKDDLLRSRADLSPAQISVIPLAGDASSVVDVLLDADRRVRACPSSMLWQYPGEAMVSSAAAQATFLGYQNGAAGPVFAMPQERQGASWPRWSDVLPPSDSADRPEGGLRTIGKLKSGSPEFPLVSYITVVRNNVRTLERTIESVQRQTYGNVEHVVLDGASTDGTLELILRHAVRLDYFVSEPDRGLYDAINKAVALARGQLICILNSDDWLEPHAAEIAVRRLRERAQGPALLATGAVIYSQAGEVAVEWPPMFVHPGSYFACANICHNGVYATPAAYECSGPYDTTFRIAADFKWVMACVDAGVDFVYTREVTVNYSLGGTSGDAAGHSRDCQRVMAERFPFLSKQEVSGLYDSYFLFAHQPHDAEAQNHEPLTSLLRRLFAQHSMRPDFQWALAWAAMTRLEHPSDRVPVSAPAPQEGAADIPSVRRLAKDLVKGLLVRSPRLYRAALSSYARLKR